jgi:medium-chain acyl-[acyl-carrier-protein] hydrolase
MAADCPWLPNYTPKPRCTLRLFCFAYAGGYASIFRTWEDRLPEEIEVCAVQLPGRQSRQSEQPATDFDSLVNDLIAGLGPYLDVPWAVFGHSLGALIGYGLVRRLQFTHHVPALHLFVSACCAPQFVSRRPATRAMSDREFAEYLRELRGTPDAILNNAELAEIVLPVVRADFRIFETYIHRDVGKLACPISAFGGLQDDVAPPEQVSAWREQTSARFEMRTFPGEHFFLDSRRAQILRAITADLSPHLGSAETPA